MIFFDDLFVLRVLIEHQSLGLILIDLTNVIIFKILILILFLKNIF